MKTQKTKTILLVDDDTDFLDQLKLQLETRSFRVITAQSQQEAETVIRETRPDLAVLDLMLEHFDGGFSLAYQLKKADPSVPVIMVSGVAGETGIHFDAATEEERDWIRADVFLAKPIRFEQLLREINRLLG
ncbi:response regulator [bacterium]|nr:response regulator [bacterium]